MSIPYIIILSDSEDENDNVPPTIFLSDSDDESHNSEPIEGGPEEEDPTEEEPEDSDPSEHEMEPSENEDSSDDEHVIPETPPIHRSGPRTIHTARKRVAIPHQRVPPSPEPSHHTIPSLVTQMTAQDLRTEHVENNIMARPRPEGYWELHEQITNLGQHVEGIRDMNENLRQRGEETVGDIIALEEHLVLTQDGINDLRERMTASVRRTVDLEQRMDHLEHSLDQFHTMAATIRGIEAYMSAWDITPK